ncbi:hypothetical protein LUZ60_000410 [Juncus effusus]|nr:hypothetical protein LUZ60_000410 [Juncus effusus]
MASFTIVTILSLLSLSLVSASNTSRTGSGLDGIGVNWGMMMSHPINPNLVIQMLKSNGIKKVKLFDADPWTLSSLGRTQIETMVAIPNNQLASIAANYKHAKNWVKHNVSKYYFDHGVDIRYVAVGNEPFLTSYNGLFIDSTFPALRNIQRALNELNLGTKIKATVPLNADVYTSPIDNPVPSAGHFRNDIRTLMHQIVHYLNFTNAPFIVNIYPYLSLYQNPDFPLDFAFFEGTKKPIHDKNLTYTNVFDANFDTLVWSLKKAGVPDLKIIVGEVGWPTDGDLNANIKNARRFYDGFLRKMASKTGTPKRPGRMEAYLFGLIDENLKSVLPGNFERHWGIFTYDGKPKFPMDLSGKGHDKYLVGAKGVEYLPAKWCVLSQKGEERYGELLSTTNYACATADCTKLGYGASCNGMSLGGNASYAFNMYFQMNDQDVRACDFQGLAKITEKNASQGNCHFPIQIISGGVRNKWGIFRGVFLVGFIVLGLMC